MKPAEGSQVWSNRLKAVEDAAAGQAKVKRRTAAVVAYEGFCARASLAAWPVSYEAVAGFLVDFVSRQNGGTASLANIKSGLKTYCDHGGIGWLSASEQLRVREVETNLKFLDMSAVRRMKPLTMRLLVRLVGVVSWESSVEAMLLVSLFVGHDGLLRGGEVWSGLQVKDVSWREDGRGFSLHLGRTKTHRARGGVYVDYTGDPSEINSVTLLRKWFERYDLFGKPEALIWTGVGRNADGGFEHRTWSPARDKSCWIDLMRSKLKLIGLDPSLYAGHSCRAGGATDLFTARMPLSYIMRYGRWKTYQECLGYFRDDILISEEAYRLFCLCV